jgi:aminomethyltransferase
MTAANNVYEVGLDYLVDESKSADYIGRAALKRIKAQGVTKKLVGIEIEGGRVEMNAVPWRAKLGGDTIGRVTSAIWSPRLKKNIGYAMVPTAQAALGTGLCVKIPGVGERRATVVPRPFVDPSKEIPRS